MKVSRTALHEAGHAVCAHVLGIKVLSATVEPDKDYQSHVQIQATEVDQIWDIIVMYLAGMIAAKTEDGAALDKAKALEAINFFCPDKKSWSHIGDHWTRLYLEFPRQEFRNALYETALKCATALIAKEKKKVLKVARALEKKRTLTGDQIRNVLLWYGRVD